MLWPAEWEFTLFGCSVWLVPAFSSLLCRLSVQTGFSASVLRCCASGARLSPEEWWIRISLTHCVAAKRVSLSSVHGGYRDALFPQRLNLQMSCLPVSAAQSVGTLFFALKTGSHVRVAIS